jgi:hypothetical protein
MITTYQDLRIEAELIAEDLFFPGPESLYSGWLQGQEILGTYSAVRDLVGPDADIYEWELLDDVEGVYQAWEPCPNCAYNKVYAHYNEATGLFDFESVEPD